jgi:muramoyltetrapeptide carboxypeptidase
VYQRFAGTDAERLAEINHLAHLPPETTVLAMRGGYGLHRLLPDVQWNAIAKAIQAGLQICGHSDFTAFQLGLFTKTGAVTLAGPMLNYDFACQGEQGEHIAPNDFMWGHFQAAVAERTLDCTVNAAQSYLSESSQGQVTGTLWGGNLTVLAGLVGTPYLLVRSKPRAAFYFWKM